MANCYLTAHELLRAVNYDPLTGIFTRRMPGTGVKARPGCVCGSRDRYGYIQMRVYGKKYAAHRLAWLAVYGQMPTNLIDHINGIRDDNRISNLRDVSANVNMQNRKNATRKNKAGLLGVTKLLRKNGYRADIEVDGKRIYLGYFQDAESAHEKYLSAKRELHVGCTI